MRGDQPARQWQLIQRLAKSHAGVGLDDLAESLGCVRRTVYRDLDALMYAGFPVVSDRRDGHVYYRFLDTFRPRRRRRSPRTGHLRRRRGLPRQGHLAAQFRRRCSHDH